MFEVFKDLGDKFLKVFVDDLNVHSENWEDHLQHLGAVFSKLKEVNLKLNPGKCCFAAKSIVFLGHVVSREGTKPDPGKIDAVLRFPAPKTITNVRSFLGLIGYYQKYIRAYSRMAGPLFELTKKDVMFVWDQNCQRAFDDMKRALMGAPILVRPDFKGSFCLDVDWSTKGVSAILSQKEGRFERVIAYASKALTVAQRKFHPMEGECYALIWGILHFRQYLHRTHFTLRTDHKPLEWLAIVSNAHGRRGRWIDMLQDFSFKIVHRPSMRHANADALSRNPVGKLQMMMISVGKSRMIRTYRMDQTRQLREFWQSNMVRTWIGSDSGSSCGDSHSIADAASELIMGAARITINYLRLML
jgi:hypothetical protein